MTVPASPTLRRVLSGDLCSGCGLCAGVSGGAVDVGPARAATWLEEHGDRYGLCRTYKNEAWHFEYRREAITYGCPRMYADPTEDPRMRA